MSAGNPNVDYVRDKRIAALLNDMVVHLLSTRPAEPLGSLVAYLEKRPDLAKGSAAARRNSSAAERQPASTSASAAGEAEQQQPAQQPMVPTPPPAKKDKGSRPAGGSAVTEGSAEAAPATSTEAASAPLAEPPSSGSAAPADAAESPATGDATAMLLALTQSEDELDALLSAVLADPQTSSADREAAAAARARCEEMRQCTQLSLESSVAVNLALDRVRSSMTDKEFYAASGFRLIHALDVNERAIRTTFRELGLNLSGLSPADQATASKAIAAHEELCGLIDAVQARQLEIATYSNNGAISESVKRYFDDLSAGVNATDAELRDDMGAHSRPAPASDAAPAAPARELTLADEADLLVERVRAEHSSFEQLAAALLQGTDDAAVRDAIGRALRTSDELQRTAADVALRNNAAVPGTPATDDAGSRDRLRALNAQIATKLLLLGRSHAAAVSRFASAVTRRVVEASGAITADLKSVLANSGEKEAADALRTQAEVESVLQAIAGAQQAIERHAVSAEATPSEK